jgi:hypothetical protein
MVLLEKDMEFSQSMQKSFLPNSTPQLDNFVFAAGTYAAHFVGAITTTSSRLETMFWKSFFVEVSGKSFPDDL